MKVKNLTPEQIEQIVALECQNILPVLASVGINLTAQQMRNEVDMHKEFEVVLCEKNGVVDGFAIYSLNESQVLIKTFNLRKLNNVHILYEILKNIFIRLENVQIEFINSQAHLTNQKSLNFHRKMGFKEVKSNNQFIEFQISKADLLNSIQRRVLKT
jgi:hypothetical protein